MKYILPSVKISKKDEKDIDEKLKKVTEALKFVLWGILGGLSGIFIAWIIKRFVMTN